MSTAAHPMPQERSWEALEWWGRWVYETCLAFGAGAHTAHGCAFHFTDGLRHEWCLGARDPA